MACPAPTNVDIVHKVGPGALVATWDYAGEKPAGFVIELFKDEGGDLGEVRRDVRTIFPSARKYTFRKLSLGAGETWKVAVSTRCVNCSLSTAAEDTVVTPE